MKSRQQSNKSYKELSRYAGLGMQLFISLAIAVFLGYKADQWIAIGIPLLVWLIPLITLALILYKIIKETSKRKTDDDKK